MIKQLVISTKTNQKFLSSLLFLVMGIALVSSSIKAADGERQPVKASSDYASTDWTLTNLEGNAVKLSGYQGQPVLLVFWATWCPYCKKLLPGIQRLHEKYQDKGLKIIAVNIREDWKPHVYWRNHEYTFDAVLEGDDVGKIYGISGTPGLVFIDPAGEVKSVQSFSDPEHPILEKFAAFYTNKTKTTAKRDLE